MRRNAVFSLLALSLLASACSECTGEPPEPGADAGPTADAGSPTDGGAEEIGTLLIAPDAQEAFEGETASFTAFLEFSDGERENVTGEAAWTLNGDDVFELKAAGAVLVLGAGTGTLTATLAGQTASATVTGRAPDVGVVSLSVEPVDLFLPVGAQASLRGYALYGDGQARDVTALATWEALTPAVASVDATDPGNPRVEGVAEGFATVRVSFGGQTLDVDVEVVAGVLEDLEIVPAEPVLPAGGTLSLFAIGRYADGELFNLTDAVTWTSNDTAVLTVDAAGLLTGVAEGTATITATEPDSAVATSVAVVVTPAQIQALEIAPAIVNVPAGAYVEVRATAILTDDAVIDVSSQAVWTLADEDVAVLEPGGMFQPLRVLGVFPAQTTLTATYAGSEATVALTVTDAVLESMELLPGDSTIPAGTQQGFFLIGTYSDGQRTNLTPHAVWTSSDQDTARVAQDPPGRVTGVAPGGPVTITATVGELAESVSVTVTDAALVSVQLTPPLLTVPAGEDVQLNAIGVYSDNTQRLINFEVTWSSADEQVGTVSNALGQKGLVTGITPGETTITAQVGGLSDTATLRVTDAVVEEIFITPFVYVLHPGHIEPSQAFATYSNGATLNVTQQVVWETTDASVVQASNAAGTRGFVTGIAEGMATVTATFAGVTGQADAYVTVQGFDRLIIWPPDVFLAPDLSVQLALIGIYAQNNDVRENLTAYAVWESSDPSIATVDNWPGGPGVVTGHAPGTVTISATHQGLTITREITVEDVTIESLELSPPDPTLPVDAVQQLVALATFDNGNTEDVTNNATFTSDDNAVATILESFPGVAIALAPGTAEVTASVGGQTASITVTVIDAVPTNVVLSPVNPIVDQFEQLRLYATALYDDGSTGDITLQCSWTSDDSDVLLVFDEPFSKGYSFSVEPGSATVTADCGAGLVDSTLVTVR
jgi:uncharacterized protein YjdB